MNSKIYRIAYVAVLALISALLLPSCGKLGKKDSKENTALIEALEKGNVNKAMKLLKAGVVDVNVKNKDEHPALMLAVWTENLECVKALLAAGADVNVNGYGWRTALMAAAEKGATECVKTLLKAGADVNVKDYCGQTALMLSAKKGEGKGECVKVLLEAGADVTTKDENGKTALIIAIENETTYCEELLREAGAS